MEPLVHPHNLREPQGQPRGGVRRTRFITGLTLMSVSFLVYPAYLLVPLLSISGTMKLGVILVSSLVSWTIFYAGIYLSGLEGRDWLEQRWKR